MANQQDFLITIRTTADTAGIKATEAQLKQLGVQVESIKQASAEVPAGGAAAGAELAGKVIGGLAIGGVYKLLGAIEESAVQINKISDALDKQGEQLVKNAQKYHELAQGATSEADVLKIASSALHDIEVAQERVKESQKEYLTFWQHTVDAIQIATTMEQKGALQRQLDARKQQQIDLAAATERESKAAIIESRGFQEKFEARQQQPLEEALKDLNDQIDKARVKQEGLNQDSKTFVRDWVDAGKEIETATKLIEKLVGLDKERKREAQETKDERQKDNEFWTKQVGRASPQVQAILKQEEAARKAREEGRERDAAMFERSAEGFKRGATPKQLAELAPLENNAGVIQAIKENTEATNRLADFWR